MADARSQRLVLPTPEAGYSYDNEAAFRREVESAINSVDQTILGLDLGGAALPTYGVALTSGTYNGTTLTSAGSVTLPDTGIYSFEVVMRYYATSTNNWRCRARYTSTASGFWTDGGAEVSGSGATHTGENAARNMTGVDSARLIHFFGYMDITAAGGDFHFDLSEISGTLNLTVYNGSYMKLTRIGDT